MLVEAGHLAGLSLSLGEARQPQIPVDPGIAHHEGDRREESPSFAGLGRGPNEDRPARGEADEAVLHEIAAGLAIPEARKGDGVKVPIAHEDERTRRAEKRQQGADQLVVELRRASANDRERGSSRDGRLVRGH